MIKIRKVQVKDIPQMATLFHELLTYHVPFDETYRFKPSIEKIMCSAYKKIIHSKDATILVADLDGRIAGYVYGKIVKRPRVYQVEKNGWMEGFMRQSFRRKGIGQKLTKELLQWFKQRGIKWVELEVDAKNKIGISAWEKFGFEDFQLRLKLKL